MNIDISPAFFKQLYQFEEVYQLPDNETFKVWILVAYPQEKTLPAAAEEFLHKILGAIGLKKQDFRISNVATKEWENYSLQTPLPYLQVWAFDTPLQALFPAVAATPFIPQYSQEIVYLQSESLESLQNNTQQKTALWQALKSL